MSGPNISPGLLSLLDREAGAERGPAGRRRVLVERAQDLALDLQQAGWSGDEDEIDAAADALQDVLLDLWRDIEAADDNP